MQHRRHLKGPIESHPRLDSTNTEALRRAREGAPPAWSSVPSARMAAGVNTGGPGTLPREACGSPSSSDPPASKD